MNCIKLTWLAMAGAALLLSTPTVAPSQAAPVGPAATQSAIAQTNSNVLNVDYYGRRGGFRHGYHRSGFRFFFFAPVVVHDGYGYGSSYRSGYGGPSCYSICRDYHGPDFCRYNWRRYC